MSDQGSEYASFIKEELAGEEARRETVNSRAFTSITASGAQFGIATGLIIFLRGKEWLPRHGAAWVFGVALGLYLLSVVLGLVATRGHRTAVASPATMRRMLTGHWTDGTIDARNVVATIRVKQIEALRYGTDKKVKWLKKSVYVQIAAVTTLAVAVLLSTAGASGTATPTPPSPSTLSR